MIQPCLLSHRMTLVNMSSITNGERSQYRGLSVDMELTLHPLSRILNDLGGKTRVMELMSHSNSDVRYQALVSVQRLVSHPWAAV